MKLLLIVAAAIAILLCATRTRIFRKRSAMRRWAMDRSQSDPRLAELISTIMDSTRIAEEAWRKNGLDLKTEADTAFRTTCCVLASRMNAQIAYDATYSLAETLQLIHELWTSTSLHNTRL